MKTLSLFLCLAMAASYGNAWSCTRIEVSPVTAQPGETVNLTCSTNVKVKQIAVLITGKEWNSAMPELYDDGSHGDRKGNDATYSISFPAPPQTGNYQVIFSTILPDRTELESSPLNFNVK